jgi:hypothetical protein
VIDEAGNLPTEHIARMSSMRSSGVAEIIKVHTERTNARTRQIWIANPRPARPLSTYSQGVLAVKELIGAPEDVARFDLVVTAGANDVPLTLINAARAHEDPTRFQAELCHQRVMWAWSRDAQQIDFSPRAVEATLDLAMTQGRKYRHTTEIPLVEPNEQRVKLARLATSAATMFFSVAENDPETVLVMAEHVQFAYEFLERLYAKPSLAFDEYARMQARRYEVSDEIRVRQIITRRPEAARSLMEQEQLTQRDLAEILGYDERSELREAVAVLRDSGFLRRQGSSFYIKTSGAVEWLRQLISSQRNVAPQERLSDYMPSAVAADTANDPPW